MQMMGINLILRALQVLSSSISLSLFRSLASEIQKIYARYEPMIGRGVERMERLGVLPNRLLSYPEGSSGPFAGGHTGPVSVRATHGPRVSTKEAAASSSSSPLSPWPGNLLLERDGLMCHMCKVHTGVGSGCPLMPVILE